MLFHLISERYVNVQSTITGSVPPLTDYLRMAFPYQRIQPIPRCSKSEEWYRAWDGDARDTHYRTRTAGHSLCLSFYDAFTSILLGPSTPSTSTSFILHTLNTPPRRRTRSHLICVFHILQDVFPSTRALLLYGQHLPRPGSAFDTSPPSSPSSKCSAEPSSSLPELHFSAPPP